MASAPVKQERAVNRHQDTVAIARELEHHLISYKVIHGSLLLDSVREPIDSPTSTSLSRGIDPMNKPTTGQAAAITGRNDPCPSHWKLSNKQPTVCAPYPNFVGFNHWGFDTGRSERGCAYRTTDDCE
jgi:hypothetical protein